MKQNDEFVSNKNLIKAKAEKARHKRQEETADHGEEEEEVTASGTVLISEEVLQNGKAIMNSDTIPLDNDDNKEYDSGTVVLTNETKRRVQWQEDTEEEEEEPIQSSESKTFQDFTSAPYSESSDSYTTPLLSQSSTENHLSSSFSCVNTEPPASNWPCGCTII